MNEDIKKVFTNRIATANKGQLIVVIYDIALEYLNLAKADYEAGNIEGFRDNIKGAKRCINRLSSSLNMEYEISGELFRLYLLMNNMCQRASIRKDIKMTENLISMVEKMRSSFEQIADKDLSKPVTMAGYTYSKSSIDMIGTSIHTWQG